MFLRCHLTCHGVHVPACAWWTLGLHTGRAAAAPRTSPCHGAPAPCRACLSTQLTRSIPQPATAPAQHNYRHSTPPPAPASLAPLSTTRWLIPCFHLPCTHHLHALLHALPPHHYLPFTTLPWRRARTTGAAARCGGSLAAHYPIPAGTREKKRGLRTRGIRQFWEDHLPTCLSGGMEQVSSKHRRTRVYYTRHAERSSSRAYAAVRRQRGMYGVRMNTSLGFYHLPPTRAFSTIASSLNRAFVCYDLYTRIPLIQRREPLHSRLDLKTPLR